VFSKEALRAIHEPAIAALVAVGLYLALTRWDLPLATVMVLMVVLARVLGQIGKLQRQYQHLVACESAFWSLQRAIRHAERESEAQLGTVSPRLHRGLRLDRVRFAYGDRQVLRSVCLTVPAGRFTAIVGASGAGKTTVVDLVTALLRPQGGEISTDELPLAQADLTRWRRMIGYVPQETFLLHDTVLHNVTLGDPNLGEADAEWALRAAGAWGLVATAPRGMQSIVGERGAKLSGGERQRLALARALVHRPRLLILDEATSALDAESEVELCATLRQLRGTLTILAISHRPAVVEAADRVYRLQEGVAVLLADRCGAFRDPIGAPRDIVPHQGVSPTRYSGREQIADAREDDL